MSVKVQAWVWEHSRTIGNDRLLLLAIADCCNDEGVQFLPTSEDLLALKSRLHKRTVQRCLEAIRAIGELEIHGRNGHPNRYIVRMDSFALVDSRRQRRVIRKDRCPKNDPRQIAHGQIAAGGNSPPRRYRRPTGDGTAAGPVAVPPLPLQNVENVKNVAAAAVAAPDVRPEPAAAATADPRRAEAEEFLAWWEFAYPSHNDGARSAPNFATDGAVVLELLATRPAYQLKHMAIAMWLVTGKVHVGPAGRGREPDAAEVWIAQSDRSIRVLRHKADWLDRRISGLPDWWYACPHTPRCDEETGCQRRLELLTVPAKDGPDEP